LDAKLKAADACSEDEITLMDFDERDLFAFASRAGLRDVHLELYLTAASMRDLMGWEALLARSPNPLAPSHRERIEPVLTEAERRRLGSHLRPLVAPGDRTRRLAVAHLWAQKRRSRAALRLSAG
jgi:hypothetical protein